MLQRRTECVMTGEETMHTFLCVVLIVVVTVITECGGQCQNKGTPRLISIGIYDKTQYITSPNYPNDYANNAFCSWQFSAAYPDYVVHVSIVRMELDSDYANCRSDYVDLFDFYYTTTDVTSHTPRLAHLCSDRYTRDIYSSRPYMYVQFVTDAVTTGPGFNLSYHIVHKSRAPTTMAPPTWLTTNTSSPTSKNAKSYNNVMAVAMGSAFAGLIVFIVVIIFVCRRCLNPHRSESGQRPMPMSVPSAPPPEAILHRHGGEPQGPQSQAVLTSHLDIPHQNGRSGSPRRGNPGGSPRHSRHYDVPESGRPSEIPQGNDRGRSPRRDDPSPRRGSPERRPGRGDEGIGLGWDGRGQSPRRGSPDRSPMEGDGRGRRGREPSPREGGPERSHDRRGSAPPPPVCSDGSGISDAPPSYEEAARTFLQPSAPPLPPP